MRATHTVLMTILGILLLCSPMTVSWAGNIHPYLIGPHRLTVTGDSVDVWVFLNDRGFQDEQELTLALKNAEQNMLLRNRIRRQKVKIGSLVDERDLRVNEDYVNTILDLGGRYRTVSRYFNAISLRIPQKLLSAISELAFVREIRPVAKARRILPESDWSRHIPRSLQPLGVDELDYGPSYDQLNQINVVAVHDSGYSGAGVLVCLLDTGFFTDHESLINQPVMAEWDFINNDPETQNEPGDDDDQHNHGTYTFSALGGAHEGDLYGPAYGATFILGKTEDITMEQPIEEDWYVAGLEWADSIGAQVVSTSLGYLDWYQFSDLDGNTAVTTIGVDIAVANGIICVTAAGNEANSSWGHIIAPADADSVIAVGAVNGEGEIASFSSPGPTFDGRTKPEVCARGVDTWCAGPWGGSTTAYGGLNGTSLSTPLVGGSCALILEAHPDWTPMMVRQALMATADNASAPNNLYGWGIIDVLAAINYNFPPQIIGRHPAPVMVYVPPDSTLDFWVSATDYEQDPLIYRWLVDQVEITSGIDSVFSYLWSSSGIYEVSAIVEDSHMGADTASWQVEVDLLGVGSGAANGNLPLDFALYGAFPNPFNASTTIAFDLPRSVHVLLTVYDLGGRTIRTLADFEMKAGNHQVVFEAANLASGIYVCSIKAGEFSAARKLVYSK